MPAGNGLSVQASRSRRRIMKRYLSEFEHLCQELRDPRGSLLALRVRAQLIEQSGNESSSLRQANLREQMRLAEQLGDLLLLGELMGKLAETFPPKAQFAELVTQESLWRRIGYHPGLARNLLCQAILLFYTLNDRAQARTKLAEAAFSYRYLAQSSRPLLCTLASDTNCAESATICLAPAFSIACICYLGAARLDLPGFGWLLWSWHHTPPRSGWSSRSSLVLWRFSSSSLGG